jgi:ubiquinol-cytochrome c reductase core subunit 2
VLTAASEHVYDEEVKKLIQMAHKKYLANTEEMAINSAHGLAFHRGLGTPLYPSSGTAVSKYLDAESIKDFGAAAYAKSNFAVVANGAENADVSKWVNQFFGSMSTEKSSMSIQSSPSKYYGGEERIAHNSGNTMVLAFPGSSSFTGGFYKPEIQVLASLLGGHSSIKWSPGFSLLAKAAVGSPGLSIDTRSYIYSDAGLLSIKLHGPANYVAKAAHDAVKTIKSIAAGDISKEDIVKARAHAKFQELEYGQKIWAGLELTGTGLISGGKAYQIDETAKAIDAVTEEKVKSVSNRALIF